MRPRLVATTVLALALLGGGGSQASDGSIQLTFDANVCQGSIPCGETRTIYVHAALAGATADGITALEYSVGLGPDGNYDAGWTFVETFAPELVAIGHGAFSPADQLDITPPRNRDRGINVAWANCQAGDGTGLVLVETVEVTNTGCTSAELRLVVRSHDVPRNSFFRCPLAVVCDGPNYTKVCLGSNVTSCTNPDGPLGDPAQCSTSGVAVINPVSGTQSPCHTTAVEASTWGTVKGMYR